MFRKGYLDVRVLESETVFAGSEGELKDNQGSWPRVKCAVRDVRYHTPHAGAREQGREVDVGYFRCAGRRVERVGNWVGRFVCFGRVFDADGSKGG